MILKSFVDFGLNKNDNLVEQVKEKETKKKTHDIEL